MSDVKVISIKTPKLSIHNLMDGTAEIKLDHFVCVRVYYDYQYTDNAHRKALVDHIAKFLRGTDDVEEAAKIAGVSAQEGPVCAKCGEAMRYNVPRMGPAGGFIHAATGKFECAVAQSQAETPHSKSQYRRLTAQGAFSWIGCGQCDVAFACHEGKARCVRLDTK
jgi:hypothetical protein